MCVERAFGMLKGRWRILLKRIDVHLKNVYNLAATCLVLHNMYIIFGDHFWKQELLREATDDVHNGLAIPNITGSSMRERLAVANLALHSLPRIDDNSRETLEFIKQENARKFEVAMGTGGKTFKELSARRNSIAKRLWMAKTKACIAETFINDREYTWAQSFSTNFSIVFCMFINKANFMSSLAFILSMSNLLVSLISSRHRVRKHLHCAWIRGLWVCSLHSCVPWWWCLKMLLASVCPDSLHSHARGKQHAPDRT